MSEPDLTVSLRSLTLPEPLWVASAHLSWNNVSIAAWKRQGVSPAALTLKTAKRHISDEQKPLVRQRTLPELPRFGRSFYCDGPKQQELLSYIQVSDLLAFASTELPNSRIGISVIADADEDYSELAKLSPSAAFAELNLKYIFRLQPEDSTFFSLAPTRFKDLLREVERFAIAFAHIPVFVKLSRELSWLPGTGECEELLAVLKQHPSPGLIVANSLKMDVPTFLRAGREESLRGGVICGETLFDQTIHLLDAFGESCRRAGVPLVATGGMIDPEHILMALRSGASAVQLCTAFVYYGLEYYDTLKWNIQSRIETQGLRRLDTYVERLRSGGVAAIYATPFLYLEDFWSDEAQRRLAADIRRSRRMDAVVMSGRTLVDRWKDFLGDRAKKGLGLRLFLPNPDGPMFTAVQGAWGLTGAAVVARQERLREARGLFEKIWAQQSESQGEPLSSGARRSDGRLQVYFHDQCPFHAVYIFDDKAYVTLYPFDRPGDVGVPCYVFFAGSKEYRRQADSIDRLRVYAKQGGVDPLPVPGLDEDSTNRD